MTQKRQIVLDTETTGLEPAEGHRIVEIGCVELVGRDFTGNNYQQYINPGDKSMHAESVEITGITTEFLRDKPPFEEIVAEFLKYIEGAELIIHNAPFDIGFLNHELKFLDVNAKPVTEYSGGVIDTLPMARKKHPGKPNSLDALCRRYKVDKSERTAHGHGALLDSRLLAEVYLRMTQGQKSLFAADALGSSQSKKVQQILERDTTQKLKVLFASDAEKTAHEEFFG